ncbi:MAG: dihydroorotate dehydrogenase electron transfer subunit [Actinobacteria bacterium]|nr:MAG: dihydroorotate dehydrogenase electron transfer subunit [Actinomycetota bacterium]
MDDGRPVYETKAQVLSVKNLGPDVFIVRLFSPEIAREALPGQFVHVRCGSDRDYILRRPFSIHRAASDSAFELMIKKVGKGTKYLAGVTPQSHLDLLGPLGTPFAVDSATKKALLVAGGLGVAPMMFLAETLVRSRARVYTVLGARTKDELYYYMEFKRMGRDVYMATDDGSQGHRGPASDLVPRAIEDCDPDVVYACGPTGMLRSVADFAATYSIPCQVSMEAYMACGIGACLSCSCQTQDGPARVCLEGPVFDATKVVW